ncbi:glycosyltransferase [Leptothoe sp. LEGE 181152]|nr:glycosyltransferase [Leptothoe sp. LEGE 181152]
MSTKVSILIPCYNAERWIAQAIQSALEQSYPYKEVIVVDDGSTDGSLAVIQSFGDAIRWETGPNQGGNAARNRLLEMSTGEWIQYLDADDYLLADKIEKQIQSLNDNLLAGVIYSPHITEHKEQQKLIHTASKITEYTEPHDLWLLASRWHLPQTGGLLTRKQALMDINGWRKELKHCQDYDLYIRLLKADKKFIYCNQAGAVYRWWCSGTVTRRSALEIYRDRLDVQEAIEKYLLSTGQLTQARKDAIYQARFEYARRIYSWNRQWAAQVAKAIKDSEPNFEPSSQIAPGLYQKLYKAVGFTGAEFIADVKRRVWK